MLETWQILLVTLTLVPVLVILLSLGSKLESASKTETKNQKTYAYPKLFLYLFYSGTLLLSCCFIIVFAEQASEPTIEDYAMVTSLTLAPTLAALYFGSIWYRYNEDTIEFKAPFRKSRSYAWSSLTEINQDFTKKITYLFFGRIDHIKIDVQYVGAIPLIEYAEARLKRNTVTNESQIRLPPSPSTPPPC